MNRRLVVGILVIAALTASSGHAQQKLVDESNRRQAMDLYRMGQNFMANEQFSDSQVAASFVHEGMHARLDRLSAKYGVTPFAQARARHERICRRAELDFGLAVPDGAPVVQRAVESMRLADEDVAPAIEWGEAERRIAQVDRAQALSPRSPELHSDA